MRHDLGVSGQNRTRATLYGLLTPTLRTWGLVTAFCPVISFG